MIGDIEVQVYLIFLCNHTHHKNKVLGACSEHTVRGWNAKCTISVRDDVAGYLLIFSLDFIAARIQKNFFSARQTVTLTNVQ